MKNQAQMFHFSASSPEVLHLIKNDPALSTAIERVGDLSYTLYDEPYSFMVNTIIGQMLSNKVADVLSARMLALCGGSVSPAAVAALSEAELRGIGISSAKVKYISGLTAHIISEPDFFEVLSGLPDDELLKQMIKLHGVGSWSAKMFMIFVLNRPDVLPYEDGAFLQSYKWLYETQDTATASIKSRCSAWKPYSSIAARFLYRALDSGLTKTPISK